MAELHFEYGPAVTVDASVRLGCSVAIVDDQGRLLLQRRTDGDWWCMPGGRLEPGETFTSAAIREAKEETGLDIEITGFLGAFTDPTICVIYPDGSRTQIAALSFIARPIGGALITANEETAELRWFAPDDLPSNLIPTHRKRIDHLCSAPNVVHVD